MTLPNNSSTRLLVLFAALLALWWLLPLGLKRASGRVFHEFQAPLWTTQAFLRDLPDYWQGRGRSKDELLGHAVDLARLNAAYALRNQQHDALREEVQRLEQLLGLPPLPDYRYEVARVVRRDLSAWWQEVLVEKGERHGIEPGFAVVFRGGVVGRVRDVFLNTSRVQLISSAQFRTAAHFEGDLRPMQFQGQVNLGLQPAQGRVSAVPPDVNVALDAPRRLVSSRLGGVFPDGLTLGEVFALEAGPDGLFQSGTVRLPPGLHSVREVTILVPLDPDR